MIQSITKVWTATLVTQLVDEGLVALKHFVDEHVARASQHLAPGRLYSYCSAGMGVLGRLVEVVRGTTYTDALRQHPTGPLHLDGVVADAGEALAFRTAIGHVRPGPGEPLRPLRTWAGLPPSNPAAGNQLAMPARGLIEFARMHLADGLGPGGARGRRSDPAYGGSVTPDGPHGPR
jgi:CubicO group peptidase (beta-lactamase class C family)